MILDVYGLKLMGVHGLKLIDNSLRSSNKLLRLYIFIEILLGISWITCIVVYTLFMTGNFLMDILVSSSIGIIHSLAMIKYYKYITRIRIFIKSLLQDLSMIAILDFSTTYSIIYYQSLINRYGKN